jgi:putative ABC transport system substrate-binding protein
MRRREFVALLSAAAAWPLAARAQRSALPVVGFLNTASAAGLAPLTAAFSDGLRDGGYIEGRNVTIEYRWAEGQSAKLPALAADLVGRNPDVIVANANAALIVKQATTTIPTVFISGSDPVKTGLVTSLNRPGGNLTGVAFFTGLLGPKRLEYLSALAPQSAGFAVLLDANQLDLAEQRGDAEAAARAVGHELLVVTAHKTSRAPSLRSSRLAAAPCWSATVRFSLANAGSSSRWRRAMRCRRATPSANMSRPAA